jgi:2-phospho-L-lactate guanylyltransferase
VAKATLDAAAGTGAEVAVVTADADVAKWSAALGVSVILEPSAPGGLDQAAASVARRALEIQLPWVIAHADLPLVESRDFEAVADALPEGGIVLVPSHDGGTNVLAGNVTTFEFAYGPGSFQRHLAAAASLPHRIVVRPNLALDLDTPDDLGVILDLARERGLELLRAP